jgi:uncharacterized membrane protein
MKYFCLLTTVLLMGCLQTENSNSQDAGFEDPSASPGFAAAQAAFANKCNGCHDFHLQTEAALIASSPVRVVPGDAEASTLYYRNQNSAGAGVPKNMPNNGAPAMTTDELQAVADWINALTP